MAARGHRFPLMIYRHMINRWWPAIMTLGFLLIGTVAVAWGAEWYINPLDNPIPNIPTVQGAFILGIGILTVAISFVMLFMRSAAYVRPYAGYLRVATPFLRFNISYKRVVRTYTANMLTLFPPKSLSNWRRQIIAPLGSRTAVVIELSGFPMQPSVLRMFLSPFFFKDKTPHIVLLVKDWMSFSTELESFRSGGSRGNDEKPRARKRGGLLSNLNDPRE